MQPEIAQLVERFAVPHVDQYFGVWAIQEEPFRAAVDRVSAMDVDAHIRSRRMESNDEPFYGYEVTPGGTAVISLTGPLMKAVSSLSGGTSTVVTRRQIRNAAADEAVRSIVLRIDSPGGTVAGTKDLADEVAAAASRKPVVAYIEDLGASAAYWVASQASKIVANPTALVGAIGTFAVIYDLSARAAMVGVKVHVIRAGEFKGAGADGAPVTPEQLAEWQRVVNELNSHFLSAVSAGRKMPLARLVALADGRVHVGDMARQLGLVDAIQSFDQVINQLSVKGARAMANVADANVIVTAEVIEAANQPASYHALVVACVGADAAFLCGQLEHKATVAQAQQAWMTEQQKRIEAATKEIADTKNATPTPGVRALGATPPKKNATADSDGDDFDAQVREELKAGKTRTQAIKNVARRDPAAHEAYLLSSNPGRKQQELIRDRFAVAE